MRVSLAIVLGLAGSSHAEKGTCKIGDGGLPGEGYEAEPGNDCLNHEQATRAEWGYTPDNGPATWPTSFPVSCGGMAQSPIDIVTATAMIKDPGQVQMIGYDLPMTGSITNSGHGITFTFDGGVVPYAFGGRLPEGERFNFLQLHWHWGSDSTKGSEHTVDGKMYPMEIHLVHWNNKYGDVGTALGESDGLAVLGFFYEIDSMDNPDMADILSVVSNVGRATMGQMFRQGRKQRGQAKKGDGRQGLGKATTSSVAVPAKIKISQLLPKDTGDYYYYQGGLTTPGCNEIVLWTNFKSTVKISEAQMAKFRALTDTSGVTLNDNFRPPQPLNGRNVYSNRAVATTPAVALPVVDEMTVNTFVTAGLAALIISFLAPSLSPSLFPPTTVQQRVSTAEERLRAAESQWGSLWN